MNSYKDELLMHYGVKGMHWGIRRYQNSDGSLTNAGKKRYGRKVRKAIKNDPGEIDRLVRMNSEINRQNAAFYNLENQIYGKKAQEVLNSWGADDITFEKDAQLTDLGSEAMERAKWEYDRSPQGKKDSRIKQYDTVKALLEEAESEYYSNVKDFMRKHKMDDRWESKDAREIMQEIRERSRVADNGEFRRILDMTPQELYEYSMKQAKKG